MDDTEVRLAKCFMALFPDLTAQQACQASTRTLKNWDSVASVTLFTLIEEEFGFSLSLDALDEFGSFEQILAHLESKNTP